MKEQCPKCKERGNDTSKDNLQRYEDGHAHCYACGYHIFANSIEGLMTQVETKLEEYKPVILPKDAVPEIDFRALTWLAQFDISMEEITRYRMLWSKAFQLLVFPIYSSNLEHELLAWQGRNFSGFGAKYWSEGQLHNIIVPLSSTYPAATRKTDYIVLVEDYISAIKVSRNHTAVCLFGSHTTSLWLKRFHLLTDTLYFWLDNDKAKEAMKLAKIASMLNFKVKLIITKNDPKVYSDAEINEAIQG